MLYRRPTQLALQATLWLAAQPEGGLHSVRDIAAALGLPAPYLAKIINRLAHVGLLQSVRGPGGGVRLGRSPRDISLWDVVTATESAAEFEACFLGLARCNDLHPCSLHESWVPVRHSLLQMLQTRTLWDSVQEADGPLGEKKPVPVALTGPGPSPRSVRS